jgi:hypothetical protein
MTDEIYIDIIPALQKGKLKSKGTLLMIIMLLIPVLEFQGLVFCVRWLF